MNYISPGGVLKRETQPRESESNGGSRGLFPSPPFYKVRTMKGKEKRERERKREVRISYSLIYIS